MTDQMVSKFDVSVLIAVKNEAKHLGATLDGLCEQAQSYVRFEVLIIDGNSNDQTLAIASSYQEKLPHLRVLHNKAGLAASGWNLGIMHSRSSIVMILSGHAKLSPHFFENILAQLTPEKSGVGGVAIPIGSDSLSTIIATAFASGLGNGGASFMQATEPRSVETIAFGCYWREDLQKVGGFDEKIVRGQDWDLNLRLTQNGQALWLDPKLKIEYATRSDFSSLWIRQFLAGYWKPYIHWKNAAPFLWRHWIPPLFVAGLALLLISTLFWEPARLILATVIFMHVGVSLWASRGNNLSFRGRLQFWWALWIIHFAYGSGFWAGWFTWLSRKRRLAALR